MPDHPAIPLVDLKPQYAAIRDEIRAAMDEVLESQWFILGPVVKGFEDDIAAYCGTKHAVGCNSGTDAILLALMALGVGPGDEVICPAYTFFSTAGSVHRLGARPVFVDIDPATYNMDPEKTIEAAARCARLRAIMPVHLYGQCADMETFRAIGDDLAVPIIEDAAQAIGARDLSGGIAGSMGRVGCFSFFPAKNLGAYGDAGICTTDDDEFDELMTELRVHGMEPKYYHKHVGICSRLDALQAAILRVKLRHLEAWTEGRRANAAAYDAIFHDAGATTSETPVDDGGLPLRTPHALPEPARHIFHQYVIRVPATMRDGLRSELASKGIATEIYYPVPLHLQECFAHLGGKPGDLPESERAAAETLALPAFPELTDAQRTHITETILFYVTAQSAVGA
jgi:dTDP-4-amino-4,6-dideoxygalactose transaminase